MRWWLLLVVLFVCLPPMIAELGMARVLHVMEDISLVSSQETWMRMHGAPGVPAEPHAWLMPTWNGNARVTKPPMLVWVNLLAWADLTPDTATPELLTWRARVVAIGMTCLMLAGVFWIGVTLGDDEFGFMAALIAGTMWFVQRQAATAAYDIHMIAWATLAMASALAAMRPRSPADGSSPYLMWAISGVFVALAWLTKNPLAIVFVVLPLSGIIAITREDRRRHILGLLLCLAVAALVALPWHIYAALTLRGAMHKWFAEYRADRNEFQPVWYYLGFFGLALPWTIWLIAGLVHPFCQPRGEARRLRLIPWFWFVLLFLFFSIPAAKQQRYIIPIVPAAALLCAFVLWDHGRAARAGKPDTGAKAWMLPHWIGIAVASIAVPVLLAAQDWLIAHHHVDEPFSRTISVPLCVLLCITGLALAWWGWSHHRRGNTVAAVVACAIWMSLISTPFWYGYARLDREQLVLADDAERVAAEVNGAPLYYLDTPPDNPKLVSPDIMKHKDFLFYSRRIVPQIESEQALESLIAGAKSSGGPLYVIADLNPTHEAVMTSHGFTPQSLFHSAMRTQRRLWRLGPV